MEMFNKIKSAVSSALPGNPLAKDFEVYGQIASGGPGMLWKIFAGMKKTTKQDAAVFLFEKRTLEKMSKRDKELILNALRKGASQLTRLRHPKVLSVIQPLEESRECLAFATEPVFASLANILGNHENIGVVSKELQEYEMYDVETKYGLLQLTEALQFLHNDVKLMHNNICPESIIVNKNGSWKLAGFDFCIPNKNPQEQSPYYPFVPWEPNIPPCAQPNLDYIAPEAALTETCERACDIFSLGILIFTIFNKGKPLYECRNQPSVFRKNAEEMRKWRGQLLGKLPEDLQDIVKLMLNTEPTVRPDPDQLSKISFFQDVGSMTLQYMDSLFQQENLQKSKFFKGLPKVLVKLPKRVNIQRILPPLLKECVNHDMIPFVLPNILQIAEQATDKEYTTHILPDLIPMFKLDTPVQIPLIFMQNMNLLLKKTPQADIKAHVFPMIYKAIESNSPDIQELCLSIIPTFADLIDYHSLKTSIVPRIKKLSLSTSVLMVRVNCLLCLGKLLESMDKWYVLDEVLPLLPQIPTREPAVLMSILGIYKVTMTHCKLGITKDILATKVLPFLIPLAIDHGLSLQQFNAYITLIKDMVGKVESEHRGKLEQLDQMKQEQKNLEISKITENDDKTLISGVTDDQPQTMMDKFLTGFGINKLSFGGANKSETSRSGSPASLSGAQNGTTETQPKPAKITLTLEEKQKLAKQQEQQTIYKSQKPLHKTSSGTTSSTTPKPKSTNQPVDLTASLMNSNMMGLQSSSASNKPSSTNYSASSGAMGSNFSSSKTNSVSSSRTTGFSGNIGSSRNSQMGSNLMNSTGSSMGMSSMGSAMGNSMGSSFGMAQSSQSQQNKPGNLSAFDGLMSNSQKPKLTMNQMSSQNMTSNTSMMGNSSSMGNYGMSGQPMIGQQGMIGNSSMMGNSSMTGNSGMIGNSSMMGNQGVMGQQGLMQSTGQNMNSGFGGQFSNTGFGMNPSQNAMGNQGNMGMFQSQPMAGQNLMQPKPVGNMTTSSSSAANDLHDLFG